MLDINEQTDANLAEAMGMDPKELDLDPFKDDAGDTIGETTETEEVSDAEDESDDVEEQESDDQEQPESDDTDQDGMDYAENTAIKAALAGDGLPQDLIEALTSDQLRSYMAKRGDRDAAFERLRSKVNAAKTPNETSEEKADEGGAPKEPDIPVSQADLTALAEEFGDNEAKQIAGYVTARVEAATRPLLTAMGAMIEAQQRSRLSGSVPGDLGEGWYEKVQSRALELSNTGMYSDKPGTQRQDALFDAALRLEFPDIPSPSEMARETKRASQRRNGAPSRAGRSTNKVEKMTKDEMTDARLSAAMDGMTVSEIQRKYPA